VLAWRRFVLRVRPGERIRLAIGGNIWPAVKEKLNSLAGAQILPTIEYCGHVAESALHDILNECALLVNLRFPTAGETSAMAARAIAIGCPVATSEYGSFVEEPAAYRITVDPLREVAELTDAIEDAYKVWKHGIPLHNHPPRSGLFKMSMAEVLLGELRRCGRLSLAEGGVDQSLRVEPIDIEDANEAKVPELDFSVLSPSVDLIVRQHFDPATVHDPDLALFARAAMLAGDEPTFIDVGANMGNTIASLIALGCRFAVHAFEINPSLHEHLRHAAALYPGPCNIHPYGLGDAPGRAWLYVPVLKDLFVLGEATLSLGFVQEERRKAQLRSYAPGETLRIGKVPVEIRTLDSAHLWADFVKIDTEGVEDRVIRGGLATLRRCRPLIMAENSYPERVRAALAPFGYIPFNFDPVRVKLYPQERPLLNTFYVEEQWAERLRQAAVLLD
jgi:FkbM family methyltransferase